VRSANHCFWLLSPCLAGNGMDHRRSQTHVGRRYYEKRYTRLQHQDPTNYIANQPATPAATITLATASKTLNPPTAPPNFA
jgi:hypothetical protein